MKSTHAIQGVLSRLRGWIADTSLNDDARVASRQAQDLLRQPKRSQRQILAAATALENAGLVNEAAALLMDHGFHESASKVFLIRMRYKDAAKIFIRTGEWERAAQCYMQDGNDQKAAQCAYRAGRFDMAAELFQRIGSMEMAARCMIRSGNRRQAARIVAKLGDLETARALYEEWAEAAPPDVALDGEERALLIDVMVSQDELSPAMARLLERSGASDEVTRRLGVQDVDAETENFANDEATDELFAAASPASGQKPMPPMMPATPIPSQAGAFRLTDSETNSGSFLSSPRTIYGTSSLAAATAALSESVPSQTPNKGLPPTPGSPAANGTNLDMIQAFASSDFVKTFAKAEQLLLWNLGEVRRFKAGQEIVGIEQQPQGTFTVLAGDVVFYKNGQTGARQTDAVGQGGNFGETWSLLSMRSSVRIVAATDCDLHVIPREKLREFVNGNTRQAVDLHRRISDSLISHLRRSFAERLPAGGVS